MRTLRMLVGLLFLGVLASYLLLAGELVEEAQWGTVGALGVLGLAWVRLGGTPRPQAVAQPSQSRGGLSQSKKPSQKQHRTTPLRRLHLFALNRRPPWRNASA